VTLPQIARGCALLSLALPALVLTHLARSSVMPVQEKPLFPGAKIDPATLALFQRACQNCHSENTQWPWYSRMPPASLLVTRDIENARRHVNFSNWEAYAPERKRDLLARLGSLVRSGQMPLARYTWLHREAALTLPERQQIYEWTRRERKRLREDLGSIR
jgi:hypothetical protein